MPVLIAPDAFDHALRAPVVAAAIARGLERAGVVAVDLCPVSSGGPGTAEVLLPALGGETADGFVLIEGGGTAIVEPGQSPAGTGQRVAGAIAAGAVVIVLAAAGEAEADADAARAVQRAGGLSGSSLVVLSQLRIPAAHSEPWTQLGARVVSGATFALGALGFDERMRAAHAVVVGEARLDAATLRGGVAGEIATRARQSGVPCHAVVGENLADRFETRILDLQAIREAATLDGIEGAAQELAAYL
jgi:glycerate kinase